MNSINPSTTSSNNKNQLIIEVRKLKKSYGDLSVLNGIDTQINKGEIISIIGPSGSGKSTFLRCLNMLETPSSGEILYHNKDITKGEIDLNILRSKVGMVFQHFNLFPHLSVLDNLIISPIKVLKMDKEEAIAKAKIYLEKVGLLDKMEAKPNNLSGGQAQRIAIARALCMQVEVLLFDEPTSALDPEMVNEVLDVIKDLAKSNITMLIVTHEMGFAKNVADLVYFMDRGLILEKTCAKGFFDNPQNQRAKDFLNKILNH